MQKIKSIENDPYATRTSIKGKTKPLREEMSVLRNSLEQYEFIKDAKIPDHEKLPKTCIYYKHYIQVAQNQAVIDKAKQQIEDDRELMQYETLFQSPKQNEDL